MTAGLSPVRGAPPLELPGELGAWPKAGQALRRLDRGPWIWLLLGALLLVLTEVRAGVGALAWIAPVPWLRYLRLRSGWRARITFAAALMAAWTAATAKIASEPRFLALAPLFALPIALARLGAYLAWDRLCARVSAALAACAFAVALALGEWALFALTPFGSWGGAAYTQIDDLQLLQAASVVGMAGVAALLGLVAASLEAAFAGAPGSVRVTAVAVGLALLSHVAGTARLAAADVAGGRTVAVAAIATDSDVRGLPLPSREVTHRWDRALLDRTRAAARGGAVLSVWPEATTLVWPDEETPWVEAVRATARESDVDVVAAYVVPASTQPFLYRNEYRLILRDGTALPPYAKRHPVVGEPAIAGRGPAPIVERPWGSLSGAICYDYDFPAMGLERARSGADLVTLPASDWRGIDPVHAQMAALRAIESGHSVLRATRFGLSLAVDPHGRTRAWHSAFEEGSGVTFAEVPRAHVRTLYAVWGDVPLAIAAAALASVIAARLIHRGATRACSSKLIRDRLA